MIPFGFGFVCGGVCVLGWGVYLITKDTSLACSHDGCTRNHWNLGNYCFHHELDEYEEHHGRGSRPG
jgi:hypothetical protein